MTLRDFQPGERFQPEATRLNAWNAAARANEAGNAGAIPEGSSGQWIALGRNTGAAGIDRFDAVELVGPSIRDDENPIEFDRMTLFDVEFPSDADAPGLVAIAQESIAVGKVGRVMVFGITPCRQIIVNNEDHRRAKFGAAGELVSASEGPVAIVWKSDESQDTRRAIVALSQSTPPTATRYGRVLSSSRDLDNYRWDYSLELVELDEAGDWQPIPDLDPVEGRNTLEASNTDTGVQGNGVNADTIPQGFDIVPIGDGAVVELRGPYGVTQDDAGFYLFTVANLVDGVCGS